MKKKILMAILAMTLTFSLVACGGETDDTTEASTEETTDTSDETAEETAENAESSDDGVINFEADAFTVEYTRHEVGEDYEGNPCLIYYFNFTNNGEEAASAAVTSYIQCFQNGVECEMAILMDENEGIDNSMKDIQPGKTIEVANAYLLEDNSEITLEASDWVSFSDEKDTQVITLE